MLTKFFKKVFNKKDVNIEAPSFSYEEIEDIFLKTILFQIKYCLQNQSKLEESYERLKEYFPEIILDTNVSAQEFKDYLNLILPEMNKRGDWQYGISNLKSAVESRSDKTEILEAYIWLSLFYDYVAEYDAAIEIAQFGMELSKELNDSFSLTRSTKHLARVYRSLGKYVEANKFFDEVISISQQHQNSGEIAHAYGSKGLVFWHLNEYENALKNLKIAQDMFIQQKNEQRTGHSFNNMGLVYTDLGMYDEALVHFEKAVAIAKERKDKKEIALTEGNIGMAYFFLKKYDMALDYLRQTMKTMDDLKSNYRRAKAKAQIALVYLNQSQDNQSLEIALNYAKESMEIGEFYNIVHFIILGASYQAMALNYLDRKDEAIELSRKAVNLVNDEITFDGLEEEIYYNHYLILKEKDDIEAVEYLKKSNDEIQIQLGKINNSDFKESFLNIDLHQKIFSEYNQN